MASLSEADRVRVRHHLGYLSTEPVASINLGFPSASQAQFLAERAMNNLIPEAVGRILKDLNVLDSIEDQQVDALKRYKAQQLGELKIRNNNDERSEVMLLHESYELWRKKLADDLGVPINVFSELWNNQSWNVPVAGA